MMKLHYIDEYREVDIPEIAYRMFEIHGLEDIKELLAPRWNSILIKIIDNAIISQLNLDETINLEDIFRKQDLTEIRKEVTRYLCK